MAEESDFWTDPETDWTQGDAGLVAMLFAAAYPDEVGSRRVAANAGLGDLTPPAGKAESRWEWVLTEASHRGRVLAVAAEMLHDPSAEVYRVLLEHKLGSRLKDASWALVTRHGLPPAPTTGPDRFVEQLQGVEPVATPDDEVAPAPGNYLEALTTLSSGFQDARALVGTMISALRRTVMIRVNGHPQGTGVLVGERLVLTACHVLTETAWPPPVESSVEVVFDFSSEGLTSEAETGEAIAVVDFLVGSLPTPAEAGRTPAAGPGGWAYGADWTAEADHLDFALLRLERAPGPGTFFGGLPRGAFRVSSGAYDYANAPTLFIVQHPLGMFQLVSVVRNAPQLSAAGTRVRYRGNTLKGSSGSPVVDARGNLVAIHHYAAPGLNQGVPVAAIVDAIRAAPGGADLVAELGRAATPANLPTPDSPFTASGFSGRPFVNRSDLRTTVERMTSAAGNVHRTLVVQGESGSGVSYSYRLASHAAECWRAGAPALGSRNGLRAHRVDLRTYNTLTEDRRPRIQQELLEALGLESQARAVEQEARSIRSLQTTLTRALVDSDYQWWLFIDSIDNVDALRQWEVDELISMLALVVDEQQTGLRLVLAGREAERFATDYLGDNFETDRALGIVRGEVRRWFEKRAEEEHRALDTDAMTRTLDELFPAGGPVPPAADIAPLLPKALQGMWR